MKIWSAEIKETEILFESLKGRIPDLEKELERLIKTDDENIVLVYSRRCLEVIIADLCETELKRPRKTEPLKGIIDKLYHEEKVPAYIITSMHGLNDLSTFGAHPKEFDPQQVRTGLINLATILRWYLKYKNVEIISSVEKGQIEQEIAAPEEQLFVQGEKKTEVIPDQIKKGGEKPLYRNPRVLATSLVIFITIIIVGFQVFYGRKVRWANEKAIPEIE